MITGISDVYYNVQNMDRAIAFYRDVLGMKVLDQNPYWTSLSLGDGYRVGLHWTEGLPVPHIPRDSHGAHAGATLTLTTTNLDEDEALLKRKGVRDLGRIDAEWGKIFIFEDVDGNVLKLMEHAAHPPWAPNR